MRLIYVFCEPAKLESGVFKKVMQQVKAIQLTGVDAEVLLLARKIPINFPQKKDIRFRKTIVPPFNNRIEKLFSARDIARAISEEIEIAGENTVLYIRGLIPSPNLSQILRKQRRCMVFFELQSFAEIEAKQRGSWETYLAMMVLMGNIIKNSDGIVGVTKQITEHYYKKGRKTGLAHFTNGNGIDVSSVPSRVPPSFDGEQVELLCVAQVANWHGLDRLIWGMANSGNSNVYLHIVGDGPAIPQLKELVSHKDLEDQVIFHGFKTGEELDEMFDKCHIAVGSLGIHRKGLKETSDLKSREYCARGIPFFNSALDADFPVSFPFRLKIPEDDSPIDMEQVMYFAKNVLADTEHPIFMQEYALSNLDWNIKMKKLKEFFEEVLKGQVGK